MGQIPGSYAAPMGAWALWLLGYPDQAVQSSRQVLPWAEGVAHAHSLAVALAWATRLHQARREFQVA